MINQVQQFIEQERLLKTGDSVVVGLSGGVDSVVLLHMLTNLNYPCTAVHCNFHLRDSESMRDQSFAQSFAESLSIPFVYKDFNTKQYAKDKGISIEMAARELRYQWFEIKRQETGAKAIAVGHHQDDSIETFLINLLRGSGIRGLTGIKPKINHIVRPLLRLNKEEILSYAAQNNIPFITDSSNLQDDYVRNKIRLQLLPLLETIHPSARNSIYRTMCNLQQSYLFYDQSIQTARQDVFNQENGTISIRGLKTCIAPETLLFEILHPYGFGPAVIHDVFCALDSQSGKEFYSETHRLLKDRDNFILTLQPQLTHQQFVINRDDLLLTQPFRMEIQIQPIDKDFQLDKNKNCACLDADKILFPLIFRRWQPGDRFIPFGMSGFKKLSDYFNDHKFNKQDKENTWVLCSGNDILWLVGERIDQRFRVDEHTKMGYIMKLSYHSSDTNTASLDMTT